MLNYGYIFNVHFLIYVDFDFKICVPLSNKKNTRN